MSATAPLFIRCPRCEHQVLEVRADWQLGVLIGAPRLDAVELDAQQITACIITGIGLWQIQRRPAGLITSSRSRWWPAGPIPGFTVPEHTCGRLWDAPELALAPPSAPAFDKPPF